MITYKDLQADLHIHTISSGHAFSTISEIIEAAQKKDLKTIAVTDHGPALPGGAHAYHFGNLRVLDANVDGMRVLKGTEANIIDSEGNLDLPDEVMKTLDFIMATFHLHCGYEDAGAEENTKALINAMERNRIHAIAHPGNQLFKLDYDLLAKTAKEMDVLIEFNNSSYSGGTSRYDARDLDLKMGLACKKYKTPVVVSSDAHIAFDVGRFKEAWELVEETGLEKKQILNLDNKKLLDFVENKR